MNATTICRRHSGLAVTLLALGAWLLPAFALPAPAPERGGTLGDETVHHLRIARQRPPCSRPSGLPIAPNDPGALTTSSGTRCYGTRPPELELWLPEDRYLWLQRSGPEPAAWLDLGPVLVDLESLEEAPLGLRLSGTRGAWALEIRQGQTATLTRLEPGAWHELTSPDGQRMWVILDAPAEVSRPRGGGRVRYRAD